MSICLSRTRQRLLVLARSCCPYSTASHSDPAATGSSAAEIQSSQSYCSLLVEKYDSPSSTLRAFIPSTAIPAYLALRAFNIEIARIADTVSTPHVGQLRMQFWRETINSAFEGRPAQQPVAILLSHVLSRLRDGNPGKKTPLTKKWFMRIIDAREKYLDNRPFVSLADLESYAENTYSTLLYLTLQSLPMNSITLDHLVSHIGKASGIAAVLRGLPLLAFPSPAKSHSNSSGLSPSVQEARASSRQGSAVLPLDVMAECGVREEDVLRQGVEAPGLRDAVFKVATRGSDHLITARSMLNNIKKGQDVDHGFEHQGEEGHEYMNQEKDSKAREELELGFGVLMPAVATQIWLRRLESVDFDVFHASLRRREWTLPWKAWLAYRRRLF